MKSVTISKTTRHNFANLQVWFSLVTSLFLLCDLIGINNKQVYYFIVHYNCYGVTVDSLVVIVHTWCRMQLLCWRPGYKDCWWVPVFICRPYWEYHRLHATLIVSALFNVIVPLTGVLHGFALPIRVDYWHWKCWYRKTQIKFPTETRE